MTAELTRLLAEYDLARDHTDAMVAGLSDADIAWRPHADSSAIGWHLGHQAAVNHFMVRNLTAAEPSIDPELDHLFDSATPEPDRGALPPAGVIHDYRRLIGEATHATIGRIASGDVGAPTQLAGVAATMLRSIVDHEYQHDTWIAEVRGHLGHGAPPGPTSTAVLEVEGYWVLS